MGSLRIRQQPKPRDDRFSISATSKNNVIDGPLIWVTGFQFPFTIIPLSIIFSQLPCLPADGHPSINPSELT
ncbi:MAG: hypothetical protein IIB95_13655 [Candidatus Marinimicrobia bacterium]|nr:hypothetical protein [Candidatus Neomarinimicrobiota bacterium]